MRVSSRCRWACITASPSRSAGAMTSLPPNAIGNGCCRFIVVGLDEGGEVMDGQMLTQQEIDERIFELYDEYCHGRIDRRTFLQRSAAATVGGLIMAQALLPRYAQAQTISFTDERMQARYVTYPSPGGNSGTMRG